MFDIGWSELFVIGAVALVAVGPRDLPRVMHGLGVWAGKARRFVLAVQHDFERMAFEAEQAKREGEARHEGPPEEEKHDG